MYGNAGNSGMLSSPALLTMPVNRLWIPGRSERLSRRVVHQRPAGFLEVRHDVVAAPLAVAALRRRPLMDSTTIPFPAVEDHVVIALADKFHVVIGAWLRT